MGAENAMHTVLDLCVELHDGVAHRVRRGVCEPKEVIIHGRGGVIEELVDCRCVRCAVDTDGIGNLVLDVLSEFANDDTLRIRKHALKGLDKSEFNERGRVGGVRDKPCDRVSGLGPQPESPGKEASCARAEGLLELSVERENVLIGELESGKRSCSRSRGVHCSRISSIVS